jgi:predicted amidohydrolase
LAICKDVSVPQHQSDTAALGIDCYVAGTVKFAHEAQAQSDRAARLAAQHGMWVAIASHAGPTGDGYTATAGGSGIWDRQGKSVAQAGPEIGGLARATLT